MESFVLEEHTIVSAMFARTQSTPNLQLLLLERLKIPRNTAYLTQACMFYIKIHVISCPPEEIIQFYLSLQVNRTVKLSISFSHSFWG